MGGVQLRSAGESPLPVTGLHSSGTRHGGFGMSFLPSGSECRLKHNGGRESSRVTKTYRVRWLVGCQSTFSLRNLPHTYKLDEAGWRMVGLGPRWKDFDAEIHYLCDDIVSRVTEQLALYCYTYGIARRICSRCCGSCNKQVAR